MMSSSNTTTTATTTTNTSCTTATTTTTTIMNHTTTNEPPLVETRQQVLRSIPPSPSPSSSSSVPVPADINSNTTKTTTATLPSWSEEEEEETQQRRTAGTFIGETTTRRPSSKQQQQQQQQLLLFRRLSSGTSSYKMGSFRERSDVVSSSAVTTQEYYYDAQRSHRSAASSSMMSFTSISSSLQTSIIQEEVEEKKKEQETTLVEEKSSFPVPIPPSPSQTTESLDNIINNKIIIRRNVNNEYTVMAFINSTSGGGKGSKVYTALVELLGSEFVVDLKGCCCDDSTTTGGNKLLLLPEDYLLPLANDIKTRILICGGDGTMGWIASSIDKVLLLNKKKKNQEENEKNNEQQQQNDLLLPFACLPLGTGNDLSRVLDWGKSYNDVLGHGGGGPKRQRRNLHYLIQNICTAQISKLDRWRLQIVPITSEPLTITEMSKLTTERNLEESLRETQSQQEKDEDEDDDEDVLLLAPPPKMNNNQSSLTEELINSWVSEKLQSMEQKKESLSSLSPTTTTTASNNNIIMNVANKENDNQQQQQTKTTTTTTTTTTAPICCHEAFDGVFCNYFSIGFDAEIALDFHNEREALLEKSKAKAKTAKRSRIRNKLAYVESAFRLGLNSAPPLKDIIQVMIERSSGSGSDETTCIEKEMVELPVPEFCRSILLLNIPSFGGGNNISENVSKKKKMKKHSDGSATSPITSTTSTNCCDYSDGLIEIYFLPNLTKFALTLALRGGIYKPVCQVKRVLIQTLTEVPCEVDGEPWKQSSSIFEISHSTKSAVLVGNNNKNKNNNHDHKNKKHHQHHHGHGSRSSKNQTTTTTADIADTTTTPAADSADPTSKRIIGKNKNDDKNKTSVGGGDGVGFLDGLCCRSTAAIEE